MHLSNLFRGNYTFHVEMTRTGGRVGAFVRTSDRATSRIDAISTRREVAPIMTTARRANDLLINVDMGESGNPTGWSVSRRTTSGRTAPCSKAVSCPSFWTRWTRTVSSWAIIMTNIKQPSKRATTFAEQHPDRFFMGLGGHDLLRPMPSLRALESFVRNHPVAHLHGRAELLGRRHVPAERRGVLPAVHEVLRARAPLCLNTGLPGPPIPGEVQNPIHLDRVCVRFPELKLCMIHGADPWWDTAIRLMIKYKNLRLMTSAWSPKYLPESLLHYMRTRGKNRIMFASDYPVLSFERCRRRGRSARPSRGDPLRMAPRQRRRFLLRRLT